MRRERTSSSKTLGGIRDMTRTPAAVWIVDTKKEHLAVEEARKLRIPIIGILDTNCDPDEVDFPIPGNDDAIRAVGLLTRVVADAVAEGLIARSGARTGETGAELGAEEPLAEWERELLGGDAEEPPSPRPVRADAETGCRGHRAARGRRGAARRGVAEAARGRRGAPRPSPRHRPPRPSPRRRPSRGRQPRRRRPRPPTEAPAAEAADRGAAAEASPRSRPREADAEPLRRRGHARRRRDPIRSTNTRNKTTMATSPLPTSRSSATSPAPG